MLVFFFFGDGFGMGVHRGAIPVPGHDLLRGVHGEQRVVKGAAECSKTIVGYGSSREFYKEKKNKIKKKKKKKKRVKVGGPIYVKRSSYINHSLWFGEPFAHKISL